MLLPWAINGIPEDSETPAVAAPTMKKAGRAPYTSHSAPPSAGPAA